MNRHNTLYEMRLGEITHWLVGENFFCVKMECSKTVRIYLSWLLLKSTFPIFMVDLT